MSEDDRILLVGIVHGETFRAMGAKIGVNEAAARLRVRRMQRASRYPESPAFRDRDLLRIAAREVIDGSVSPIMFTESEMGLLGRIANRQTNKRIREECGLSGWTLRHLIAKLYDKLGVIPDNYARHPDLIAFARWAMHEEWHPSTLSEYPSKQIVDVERTSTDSNGRFLKYSGIAGLSPREREVCDLIMVGFTNKRIAEELGVETRTVENHVHRIVVRLGVPDSKDISARVLIVRVYLVDRLMEENAKGVTTTTSAARIPNTAP